MKDSIKQYDAVFIFYLNFNSKTETVCSPIPMDKHNRVEIGENKSKYTFYTEDLYMENGKQVRITSSEIAQLWAQYLNDSGSGCILTYFLEKAEDTEIKSVIEYALELSNKHIEKLTSIFTEEKYTIPHGFKI